MLIQPDTYIRLIKNCPLDKTYDHTIYFESPTAQVEYFKNTLQGIPFSKQSYQRYDSGVLHIQERAENLYNCNYLMFQNTAFGDKWFYAFITSVEYVNNVSSRVTYEIDVMQTWFFNYTLQQCFVEREHSETDEPGENLIPEKLDVGDYVLTQVSDNFLPFKGGEYDIIIAQGTAKPIFIDDETGKPTEEVATVVANVFTGIDFIRFNNPTEAYAKLKKLNDGGNSNEVVGVFQVPSAFLGDVEETNFSSSSLAVEVGQNLSHNYTDIFKNNPLDDDEIGYTPKNKKLYTAPYFGITATSSSGENLNYAYEYFKDPKNPRFSVVFSLSAVPEAVLSPLFYKGLRTNIGEELLCKDFPQCAYATDSFREYLALNAGKIQATTANTALNLMSNPNPISSIGQVMNLMGEYRDRTVMPDKTRGNSLSYLNYTRNKAGFILYQYKIRKEYAKIIDNYFNMFGYAVNTTKVPNRNVRPHWTYTKTNACVIIGSLPANVKRSICDIYNKGITFWKNANEIGNYSLDNSPT